jgi:hypothetical protein
VSNGKQHSSTQENILHVFPARASVETKEMQEIQPSSPSQCFLCPTRDLKLEISASATVGWRNILQYETASMLDNFESQKFASRVKDSNIQCLYVGLKWAA